MLLAQLACFPRCLGFEGPGSSLSRVDPDKAMIGAHNVDESSNEMIVKMLPDSFVYVCMHIYLYVIDIILCICTIISIIYIKSSNSMEHLKVGHNDLFNS